MTVEVNKTTPTDPKTPPTDSKTKSVDPKVTAKNKLTEERNQKEEQIKKRVIPNSKDCCDVTVKTTFHGEGGHEDRDLSLADLRALLNSSANCDDRLLDRTYDLTDLNAKKLLLANIPSCCMIHSIGFTATDVVPPEAKLTVTGVNPDSNPTILPPEVLKADKVIELESDVVLMGGTVNLKVHYTCPKC